jgi:hypothetical protein
VCAGTCMDKHKESHGFQTHTPLYTLSTNDMSQLPEKILCSKRAHTVIAASPSAWFGLGCGAACTATMCGWCWSRTAFIGPAASASTAVRRMSNRSPHEQRRVPGSLDEAAKNGQVSIGFSGQAWLVTNWRVVWEGSCQLRVASLQQGSDDKCWD